MANPLVRQLRKEVVANPKKALILGGLLVLALWFWAPLLTGWISGSESSEESVAVAAGGSAITDAAPTPSEVKPLTATQPKAAAFPWRQILRWMQDDPRTTPANLQADFRDPFATVVVESPAEEPEEELAATQQEITPESLGMVLSSTIVGSHRRVARIGGKSYGQGAAVQWDKDGQQFEFVVAEVHPRHIVLLHEGQQFDLRIPGRAGSDRIELRPAGN